MAKRPKKTAPAIPKCPVCGTSKGSVHVLMMAWRCDLCGRRWVARSGYVDGARYETRVDDD